MDVAARLGLDGGFDPAGLDRGRAPFRGQARFVRCRQDGAAGRGDEIGALVAIVGGGQHRLARRHLARSTIGAAARRAEAGLERDVAAEVERRWRKAGGARHRRPGCRSILPDTLIGGGSRRVRDRSLRLEASPGAHGRSGLDRSAHGRHGRGRGLRRGRCEAGRCQCAERIGRDARRVEIVLDLVHPVGQALERRVDGFEGQLRPAAGLVLRRADIVKVALHRLGDRAVEGRGRKLRHRFANGAHRGAVRRINGFLPRALELAEQIGQRALDRREGERVRVGSVELLGDAADLALERVERALVGVGVLRRLEPADQLLDHRFERGVARTCLAATENRPPGPRPARPGPRCARSAPPACRAGALVSPAGCGWLQSARSADASRPGRSPAPLRRRSSPRWRGDPRRGRRRRAGASSATPRTRSAR